MSLHFINLSFNYDLLLSYLDFSSSLILKGYWHCHDRLYDCKEGRAMVKVKNQN